MSGGNEDNLEVVVFEVFDFFGLQRVLGVTVTQLAVFAIAPAKYAAIEAEAERVLPTTCNLDDRFLVDYPADHSRHMHVFGASMTELAKDASTPGVDLAFVGNSSCVMVPAVKG